MVVKFVFAALLGLVVFFRPASASTGGRKVTDEQIDFALPDTRGFRNNNPGNIEFSERNNWNGQTGTDGRYSTFSDMKFGIRAIGKILNSYSSRYGLNTIRGVINRWAPDDENNTVSYVSAVSQRTGIDADGKLSGVDYLLVVEAIIHHENGSQPFPLEYISEALAL